MRVFTRRFLQVLTVLALLAVCHTASAFYDPHVGRWVSRDPIGERGGNNLYAMVGNDAINAIDPDGRLTLFGLPQLAQPLAPTFVPRILPNPVPTGLPRFYPPVPLTSPYSGPQPHHPIPQQPPGEDPLPRLNELARAPKSCKQTCPNERLKHLNDKVADACKGKLSQCHDDDPYWQLVIKFHNFNECIKARTQRERECWQGGDRGHVKQINDVITGRENCRQKINEQIKNNPQSTIPIT